MNRSLSSLMSIQENNLYLQRNNNNNNNKNYNKCKNNNKIVLKDSWKNKNKMWRIIKEKNLKIQNNNKMYKHNKKLLKILMTTVRIRIQKQKKMINLCLKNKIMLKIKNKI